VKKSSQKFPKKPVVRKKHGKKLTKAQPRELRKRGWMVVGFDTSMSSIAGAAIGYDRTLDKYVGPKFSYLRWEKEDHYFARLSEAAKSHEIVLGLQADLGLLLNLDEIFIAQEEPWPMGMSRGGLSAFMKQQAEVSGAFLGGLLRYGYKEIWQINSIRWRKLIADDLEITTHHSKWKSPELAKQYNCKPGDSGKFRSKEWAFHTLGISPWLAQAGFPEEIPDWPDIIESKDGKKPRPEGSIAKAVQPDDRYDSLAIMEWLRQEISETLDELTLG
jgi:hypothetical protein